MIKSVLFMFELSVVTKKLGKFDFRKNSEGKNIKNQMKMREFLSKLEFFVFPVKLAFSTEMR